LYDVHFEITLEIPYFLYNSPDPNYLYLTDYTNTYFCNSYSALFCANGPSTNVIDPNDYGLGFDPLFDANGVDYYYSSIPFDSNNLIDHSSSLTSTPFALTVRVVDSNDIEVGTSEHFISCSYSQTYFNPLFIQDWDYSDIGIQSPLTLCDGSIFWFGGPSLVDPDFSIFVESYLHSDCEDAFELYSLKGVFYCRPVDPNIPDGMMWSGWPCCEWVAEPNSLNSIYPNSFGFSNLIPDFSIRTTPNFPITHSLNLTVPGNVPFSVNLDDPFHASFSDLGTAIFGYRDVMRAFLSVLFAYWFFRHVWRSLSSA
jgi:hypothetical protein